MAKRNESGSTMAIAGHPIHPMLVNFPITFLNTALVTDLVFLWNGNEFWAHVSFWAIVAGLVTGGVAALVGTLDFILTPTIRRFVGSWSHFIAGIMVLAIAGSNLVWRWENPVESVLPWGIALTLLNVVVVMLAGWMGGKLVFDHNIGVSPPQDHLKGRQ